MTVIAKQIASAFYGDHPQRSYFTGCSTGGRQALMEAQRFPDDYDGIIAGDPVAYYSHHHVGGNLWVVWQMFNNPAGTVFTRRTHFSATRSTQPVTLLMVSWMAF